MVRYPFTFEIDDRTLSVFHSNLIYLKHFRRIEGVHQPGKRLTIAGQVWLEPEATLPAGSFLSMGMFSYALSALDWRTTIGRYCSVAKGVSILGIDHPTDWISTHPFVFREHHRKAIRALHGRAPDLPSFEADHGPVWIGHDVWIGQDVRIRSGVSIGHGAIVASGAIVTQDVPPYAIVGGVPARIIRFRFEDAMIERLLRVGWWQYHAADFAGFEVDQPATFLDRLEERIASGTILPCAPAPIDLAQAIASLPAPEPETAPSPRLRDRIPFLSPILRRMRRR